MRRTKVLRIGHGFKGGVAGTRAIRGVKDALETAGRFNHAPRGAAFDSGFQKHEGMSDVRLLISEI